jgi:chromosome segregation ATPase
MRVSELMTTMRHSEELTRRILAAELEMSRAKQLNFNLEGQTEAVRQDLDAMNAQAEDARELHRQVVTERDATRDELHTLERDLNDSRKETADKRGRIREVSQEVDSLQHENMELKLKLRALEDNVNRMRKLRDELLSNMGQLSQSMASQD